MRTPCTHLIQRRLRWGDFGARRRLSSRYGSASVGTCALRLIDACDRGDWAFGCVPSLTAASPTVDDDSTRSKGILGVKTVLRDRIKRDEG